MTKYGSQKTEYSGRIYHSKREAAHAAELDALKRAPDGVKAWIAQPVFPIVVNGKKICTYVADFEVRWKDGRTTIIDVKGYKTPLYKLKKKLVEALYGITITEK